MIAGRRNLRYLGEGNVLHFLHLSLPLAFERPLFHRVVLKQKTEERNRSRKTPPRQPLLPSTPHTLPKKLRGETSFYIDYAFPRTTARLMLEVSESFLIAGTSAGLASSVAAGAAFNSGDIAVLASNSTERMNSRALMYWSDVMLPMFSRNRPVRAVHSCNTSRCVLLPSPEFSKSRLEKTEST